MNASTGQTKKRTKNEQTTSQNEARPVTNSKTMNGQIQNYKKDKNKKYENGEELFYSNKKTLKVT